MSDYVSSSPVFFRMIKRCIVLVALFLLVGTLLIPAPLQPPADIAQPPNPAKAAWFLLWIQELLSYSNSMVYLILAVVTGFISLPFWKRGRLCSEARWFAREDWAVILFSLLIVFGLILLTLIAWLWRGENWSIIWSF